MAAAASTAAARSRSRATSRASDTQQQWTGNQEMIDVSSRPESIHEQYIDESEEENQDTGAEQEYLDNKSTPAELADVRSIKSVSSMMSKEDSGSKNERATISNRLASIGVLGRLSGPTTSDESGAPSAEASPSKVCPVSLPLDIS
jgi:hypothetical protein